MLTVLSKVWDSVSGGVTERFLGRLFGPASLFWGLGGLAYSWSRHLGPEDIVDRVENASGELSIALAVIGALVLVFSNAMMELLDRPLLRALEGYWPPPFRRLLIARVETVRRKVVSQRKEWEALARTYAVHTAEERLRYRHLDRALSFYPENEYQLKPTVIGNVLAASENYPWARYGLASVLTWPRLWLVMDESSRAEITASRSRLNGFVQLLGWLALSLVWVIWAWWVPAVSIVGLVIAYRGAASAASGYGELVKGSFDVYHRDLLQRVGLLENGEAGIPFERGRALTLFLRRGIRPG
jgi:hypothetical protein